MISYAIKVVHNLTVLHAYLRYLRCVYKNIRSTLNFEYSIYDSFTLFQSTKAKTSNLDSKFIFIKSFLVSLEADMLDFNREHSGLWCESHVPFA